MIPDYTTTSATLYDDVTDPAKVGRFRAWYHSSRFARLRAEVNAAAQGRVVIVDVACGNCVWNLERVPVVGVDINQNMLRHARHNGRLTAGAVVDMSGSVIPLATGSADVIVCSEVLEHMPNYQAVIGEFFRILRPGGRLIATVPYDQFGTPFYFLFNGWCLFKGYVLGDDYYKQFCGHINHFSMKRIGAAISRAGFALERQFAHNAFVIYNIARKPAGAD